jgi:hypothetical protein
VWQVSSQQKTLTDIVCWIPVDAGCVCVCFLVRQQNGTVVIRSVLQSAVPFPRPVVSNLRSRPKSGSPVCVGGARLRIARRFYGKLDDYDKKSNIEFDT